MSVRVVILARYPTPGQCKTRLIPALGPDGAAAMHKRLAEHTVETACASGLKVELWGTGAPVQDFADWLGSARVTFRKQSEGDLGTRLDAASDPHPVLFLGTDCPDFRPDHLSDAADALGTNNFVIGPAHDGGYWTIGLPRPAPFLFTGMPWGTSAVYETTRSRMKSEGIEPVVLETLHDLDRPEDLDLWPDLQAS